MNPIVIEIPAMKSNTYRTKGRYAKAIVKKYICGYLACPSKRITNKSSQSERDLVSRQFSWKRYARKFLQEALVKNGMYKNHTIQEKGWHVHVQPYHENYTHPDGTNVLKGLEDILVSKERGLGTFFFRDDKNLAGSYGPPAYDKRYPRLVVTLTPPTDFQP